MYTEQTIEKHADVEKPIDPPNATIVMFEEDVITAD